LKVSDVIVDVIVIAAYGVLFAPDVYAKVFNVLEPDKSSTTQPLDPVTGLYYDFIYLDYTSLYPSIIKSLNLGIETLVGRIEVNSTYEQNYSLAVSSKITNYFN
jgi:DNA polymerase elongation subunit (family B)